MELPDALHAPDRDAPTPSSAARAIRAGDKVVLWYVSGNRDEAEFDDPDTFDIAPVAQPAPELRPRRPAPVPGRPPGPAGGADRARRAGPAGGPVRAGRRSRAGSGRTSPTACGSCRSGSGPPDGRVEPDDAARLLLILTENHDHAAAARRRRPGRLRRRGRAGRDRRGHGERAHRPRAVGERGRPARQPAGLRPAGQPGPRDRRGRARSCCSARSPPPPSGSGWSPGPSSARCGTRCAIAKDLATLDRLSRRPAGRAAHGELAPGRVRGARGPLRPPRRHPRRAAGDLVAGLGGLAGARSRAATTASARSGWSRSRSGPAGRRCGSAGRRFTARLIGRLVRYGSGFNPLGQPDDAGLARLAARPDRGRPEPRRAGVRGRHPRHLHRPRRARRPRPGAGRPSRRSWPGGSGPSASSRRSSPTTRRGSAISAGNWWRRCRCSA